MKNSVRLNRTFKGVSTNFSKSFKHIALALMLLTFGVGNTWGGTKRVYCKMTYSWWTNDNASIGAYYWGGSNGNSWPGTKMTSMGSGVWYIDIDDSNPNIIFTRLNTAGNSYWSAKTADLTHGDYNYYTITSSSGVWDPSTCTGTWSKYAPTACITGSMNSWSPTANPFSAGSVSISLSANTTYEFKVQDGTTFYGNNSAFIGQSSSLTMSTSEDNCHLTTTTAGTYTFSWNSSTKALTVTYPSTTHPNSNYVYFKKPAAWSQVNAHVFTGGAAIDAWPGPVISSFTFDGTVYYYAVLGGQTSVVFSDNGNDSKKTSDLTTASSNKGKYYDTSSSSWKPFTVTITLNNHGATSAGTTSKTATYKSNTGLTTAITCPTKTGYTFGGYYTSEGGAGTQIIDASGNWLASKSGYTDASKNWIKNTSVTLHAKWTAKSCSISLNYQNGAAGYLNSGSISNAGSLTATYDAAMTALTGTMPSAKPYYKFMGFYSGTNGTGTKYYNADGSSARTWNVNTTATTTLYAYYQVTSIASIALTDAVMEIVPAATGDDSKDYVLANPTINPTVGETTTICWKFYYSDGTSEVPGVVAEAASEVGKPNQVRFPIAGLSAGVYQIEATIRKGSGCEGDVLHSLQTTFRIAGDFSVQIKYMCGDLEIKERISQPGNPLEWTDVTAPDIIGYAFSEWHAGDGITLQSSKTTKNNKYKTDYDGTLTAKYTKKRTIYFNNTLGWSSVYVYFYKNSSYWDESGNNWGTGANTGYVYTDHPYSEGKHGVMTRIDGTNIWYFDCEAAGVNASYVDVAFTEKDEHGQGYFGGSGSNKVVRRGDFNWQYLPMFVPCDQTPQKKNNNKAEYYNQGYWMNYPENTGYKLMIYNKIEGEGTELIQEVPFEYTANYDMPMSLNIDLGAAYTYGFKVLRADDQWFGNNGTMKNGESGTAVPWIIEGETKNCGITTAASGTYVFTLSYNVSSGKYQIAVFYPAEVNDYRIVYTDGATWSYGAHTSESWIHPSSVIPREANKVDTVSFFISKGSTPKYKIQRVNSINNETGAVTWADVSASWQTLDTVSKAGVYNLQLTQDGSGNMSVTKIWPYTGDYYIRCGALSSKWASYRVDPDHLMTYSAFSESDENSFGDKFSHYKTKWCPRGKNVMFCIANDYSSCISDTLIRDNGDPYANIWEGNASHSDGELKAEGYSGTIPNTSEIADRYSANIRFMWNWKTNKISRAYVASATNTAKRFLVLVGQSGLKDKDGNAIAATANLEANALLLNDDQNWIYETYLQAVPGTLVKLYASYAQASPSPNGAQYFRGSYNGGTFNASSAIQILGGSGAAQKMRVLYDFKTNRLVTAWIPSGTISGTMDIDADAMIIRDHQGDAACITFSTAASKLTDVKTVYGVMQFNRWTLNNRQRGKNGVPDEATEHCDTEEAISEYHPLLEGAEQLSSFERQHYFISFPFDVNLSDVFGFGTYGTHWVISTYNGLRRAQQGYFYDNCFNHDCTNWDFIHEDYGYDTKSFVLKAGEGYLLSLALNKMQYDDTTKFWLHQIHNVELFFPSAQPLETIEQTTATTPALSSAYECHINNDPDGTHPEMDHRKKDSYWRCLGVPSFNSYTDQLKTGPSGTVIAWQSHPQWEVIEGNLPFLYEWNTTDNSIMPRSTSNYNFRTTFAYLVQCSSDIYWQEVTGKQPSPIVARQRKSDPSEYNWRLTLEKDGVVQDQTFIRMADVEAVTDTFDFGQDLIKEANYKRANIQSLIGHNYVAANSMPKNTESKTIVPLSVILWNAGQAGDYTFNLPDGADGVGITLVDKEANVRTNLSTGMAYTVALSGDTIDGRFELEISPIKNTPTGVEETETGEQKAATRKMLIDGQLYIIRDEKVFDARGIRVQ